MYQIERLNNKIRLASAYMPQSKSCSCGAWVNVGGRFENEANSGISHFIEHLVFKGTRNFSCDKIKNEIEGRGGSLNAFTSEEMTCYYAKVLPKDLWRTMNILTEMVKYPLFRAQDIKKELTVIIEEIKMYKDLPQAYVSELLNESMWPNQPLGMNLAGTVSSVSNLAQKDFSLFKEKHYTNPNIVVAIAGPIPQDKIIKNVEKLFLKPLLHKKNQCVEAKSEQKANRINTLYKKTEQTHIAMGVYGLKRDHKSKFVLELLNVLLGANMSSRLFKIIREKHGLAYAISSNTKYFQDTGFFGIHAGLDNTTVRKAIKLIINEIAKLKDILVPDSEFKRAKDFCIGQILLNFETTMNNMLWVGETVTTLDRIVTQDEIINSIHSIKKEAIRDLARQLFRKNRMNLSVIGPVEDKFEQEVRSVIDKNA